ncbi:MAG: hypothetical protein P8N76_18540 [Pirellulaceae bacterium]|nr:hypothetical protein [Pirellulaceae bacterium]
MAPYDSDLYELLTRAAEKISAANDETISALAAANLWRDAGRLLIEASARAREHGVE